jgi:hypothetical protein
LPFERLVCDSLPRAVQIDAAFPVLKRSKGLRYPNVAIKGVVMGPSFRNSSGNSVEFIVVMVAALSLLGTGACRAQDVPIGVTYVCSGEHIYVEGCNIRDTSDISTCMVAHPDHLTKTGLNSYTTMTRGALKKLLPSCTQPTAQQIAAARAFEQKQQDTYNANLAKATQPSAPVSAAPSGQGNTNYAQPYSAKTPEQRALARCITSGRLPASCTGNSLLGAFGQMVSAVLPSATKEPAPGPNMAGVFIGAGNWRLDFIDNGVLVNCAFLSPDQRNYSLEFKADRTNLIIDTTPKPLVLTVRADGTIVGPGPVVIDGVVGSVSSGGDTNSYSGGYHDSNGMLISNSAAASSGSPVYDSTGNRVYGAINAGNTSQTTFSPRRATCPALTLSTKGAGVGVQTMQTDLLKTMFGGDKGAPTPPGIRMHGIFAASSGFSVQFFPESAILGCGPEAARAYPYTVTAEGAKAIIKIDAADHPLTLAYLPNGTIDASATGPYQVHGRRIVGQNDDGDFTFAPFELTCNLAQLTPSATIPSGGGAALANAAPGAAGVSAGGGLSTPQAPLGNATLSIVSGFVAQPGTPGPLAGHPYILLRSSYGDALAQGGVSVPAGMSPYKYAGAACGNRTPDCAKVSDAIKASAASAVRADANGNGTLPGVPPGTYYLMISARYNNQPLVWGQAVQLKAGANSITLDQRNATPLN